MWQKNDLIIQLEIYSVARNFIWFTLAKLQTIFVPFERTYPWLSHHTGLGPVKVALSQIIPNFFKLYFPHGCIYNSHDCLHM